MMRRRTFLKSIAALASGVVANAHLPTIIAQNLSPQLLIPPTVQHVTETTVTIYCRLARTSRNATLSITHEDAVVQEIPLSENTLSHQLTISDLQPATRYGYRLLIDEAEPRTFNNDTWSGLSFTTPPYDWPIRLAALGDTGFGQRTTATLATNIACHEPHFMLHLGDVVYWMEEYNNDHFLNWYLKYFKPFYPVLQNVPVYPTVGNHEYETAAYLDDIPSYFAMFPSFDDGEILTQRNWYTFVVNDVQFISLNSQLYYRNAQALADQTAWLDTQLARTDSRYKVVFFHIALFNSGAVHQWDGQPFVKRWVPRFEANNVKLVLSGHAHLYERLLLNGVHYVVAGAGSSIIYGAGERLPHSQFLYSAPSFPIIELFEDQLRITAYDVEGTVIDEITANIG